MDLSSYSTDELLSVFATSEQVDSTHTDVLSGLFDRQIAFVKDTARKKIAFTSSRAGKTWSVSRYIVDTAIARVGDVVYLTDTRDHAVKLIYDTLVELLVESEMVEEINKATLTFKLKNGSRIWLYGIDSSKLIERLRGHKYTLVCIDEVQSCNSDIIKTLINSVLGARMRDLDGTLCLTFTPPEVPGHYVTELLEDKSWSVHRWNMFQNPKFGVWCEKHDWEKIAEQCKALWQTQEREGVFQREYLGNLFYDAERYAYCLREEQNLLVKPLTAYSGRVLGIDLGWTDCTAWMLHGYSQKVNEVHLLDHDQQQHLTVDQVVERTRLFITKHAPDRIVVDSAGLGKMVLETLVKELRKRYNVPIVAADKPNKAVYMKLWANDMYHGRYKLYRDEAWAQLANVVVDNKTGIEIPNIPVDMHDAGLYSWRICHHFIEESKPPVDERSIDEKMFEEYMDNVRATQNLGLFGEQDESF